jgi:hypothetical protein
VSSWSLSPQIQRWYRSLIIDEDFFDFSHNAHGFFIKVVEILQVFEIDDLAMKSRLPSLPPAKGFASRPLLLKHKLLADTFSSSDFLTPNSSCSSNYHHC